MFETRALWKHAMVICSVIAAAALGAFNAADALTVRDLENKVVSQGGYEGLLSRAQQLGRVRVLVKVNVPYSSDGSLVKSEALAQRSAITSAQNKVLTGLSASALKAAEPYKYRYIPYVAMKVDPATLDTLLALGTVADVQEDVADPPDFAAGWDISLIGADSLHALNVKGSGITVAVLDTGVDKTHPYLSGAVVSEACYSTTDVSSGTTSLCPGGATDSTATGSALPYASGVCPTGECDHGTHVSGTVAGRSSVAGSPGPGVAPETHIIAIQVFTLFPASSCGGSACVASYRSDQIKGLERVYELTGTYTIASLNMSLGGGQYSANCDSDARKSIIDSLRAAGTAAVISSGNNGFCGYMSAPACISSAVSVGATDSSDAVAYYSNSASFLSIFAPGSAITSSLPGSQWGTWDGTSMAAPHVAGSWAPFEEQEHLRVGG